MFPQQTFVSKYNFVLFAERKHRPILFTVAEKLALKRIKRLIIYFGYFFLLETVK